MAMMMPMMMAMMMMMMTMIIIIRTSLDSTAIDALLIVFILFFLTVERNFWILEADSFFIEMKCF